MSELDNFLPECATRIRELRAKAMRARDHAARICDPMAAANLNSYAVDLDTEAAKLEAEECTQTPPRTSEPR
jgi:hypothetical protein